MIYTNAILNRDDVVQTIAGRLLPSSSHSIRPNVLVYEFIERIEEAKQGPGVLISSGVEPYLQDYSVVVSFALNCTCTPDVDLARRLSSGQRGLATRIAPRSLVRRFFDEEVWYKQDELKFLESFTDKLIRLPRITFLGVMRALRTFVIGMHRIADDLELAYTLLVASVEALAQEFDGHKSDWDSLDERKRKEVDKALSGADEVVAQRVREALLKVEHVALARRFREFAVAHIRPEYFRQTAVADALQLERSDLVEVLGTAYQARSRYVHQLRRLPDMVTLGHGYHETTVEDRATYLTLQGLARLMRSVIVEFVMQQPSIDQEPYDYHLERTGVVRARLDPQYWVGGDKGDITKSGRDKLEGFLHQLESCLLRRPNAVITDLRSVLVSASVFVPGIERRLRLPYLALYVLFNAHVARQDSVETPSVIEKLIQGELSEPSSEALIAYTLLSQSVSWQLDVHEDTLNTYFRRRASASGLRFPRTFEAAMVLDLAERYRGVGALDESRAMVALAVENHPGHTGLLEFETNLQPDVRINWRDVMLPALEQPEQ